MLDWRKLLATQIPDIRQRITSRDVVFYALSVGFGQDPLDARQLDFVDVHRNLRVVPSMAIIMANPGFWYRRSDSGVDPKMLVHGEQSVIIHKPLPIEGEVIGRFRPTHIVDKGAGKGVLLYTEKQLLDAATGETLAVAHGTTFIRGSGGIGAPDGPVKPVHSLPETAPDFVCDLATRPEQALYYRLNGDDNPLHADPAVAVAAGFPGPILHGLCTLGTVTHALLRHLADYDETRFKSLSLRFSSPVYPGETICTEIWKDGSFRARVVERDVIAVNNGKAEFL